MPEATIKYAVNSTLGTDDFKPLDQIIVGEKLFVATDTPIVVLANDIYIDGYISDEIFSTLGKFTPRINGSVRIKTMMQTSYSGAILTILKDGVKEYSFELTENQTSNDINVVANSVYTIQIQRVDENYMLFLETASICAQVTDYNYFDYETV